MKYYSDGPIPTPNYNQRASTAYTCVKKAESLGNHIYIQARPGLANIKWWLVNGNLKKTKKAYIAVSSSQQQSAVERLIGRNSLCVRDNIDIEYIIGKMEAQMPDDKKITFVYAEFEGFLKELRWRWLREVAKVTGAKCRVVVATETAFTSGWSAFTNRLKLAWQHKISPDLMARVSIMPNNWSQTLPGGDSNTSKHSMEWKTWLTLQLMFVAFLHHSEITINRVVTYKKLKTTKRKACMVFDFQLSPINVTARNKHKDAIVLYEYFSQSASTTYVMTRKLRSAPALKAWDTRRYGKRADILESQKLGKRIARDKTRKARLDKAIEVSDRMRANAKERAKLYRALRAKKDKNGKD